MEYSSQKEEGVDPVPPSQIKSIPSLGNICETVGNASHRAEEGEQCFTLLKSAIPMNVDMVLPDALDQSEVSNAHSIQIF